MTKKEVFALSKKYIISCCEALHTSGLAIAEDTHSLINDVKKGIQK